jgi:hypothetical protein
MRIRFPILVLGSFISCFAVAESEFQEIQIPKIGSHEDCRQVKKGQFIKFNFESDVDLRFNLHYHLDKKIVFPYPNSYTTKLKSKFQAPIDHSYCLMWKNRQLKPANLKYKFKIKDS